MQAARRAIIVGMACFLVLGFGCTQKKGVTSEGGAGAQNVGGIYVELSRESVDVEAGGSDTVSVLIAVYDNSFVGIEGIQVEMRATGGVVGQPEVTDANGQTATVWNSAGIFGEFNIIARAGGKADTAIIVVNSTGTRFGTLLISTDTKVIYADRGRSFANITAILKDQYGEPQAQDSIKFSAPGYGTVKSPVLTDSFGVARTTFKDAYGISTAPDSAMVIARYSNWGLADTAYIVIEPEEPVGEVNITVQPDEGVAAKDSATVRVNVFLENGLRAPDNTEVMFHTDCGDFKNDTVKTTNGIAFNTYYFCPSRGTATIYASVGVVVSNEFTVIVNPGAPKNVSINATPNEVYIGSQEVVSITAQVNDTVGNPVFEGALVSFSTTHGSINENAATDNDGIARAILNPGTQAGNAKVKAFVGAAVDSVTVRIVAGTANTLALNVSPASIRVRGTGGVDQALVEATVLDANQNPIPDGKWVTFQIVVGPGGGVNINGRGDIDSAQTSSGIARVTLNAGIYPGIVDLRASTYVGDEEIFAHKSNISVVSGPPASISLQPKEIGTDAGGGGWQVEVAAQVRDMYNNPVSNNWVVFFSVEPDVAAIVSDQVYTGNPDENGDSRAGFAYTQLTWLSSQTFQPVIITAECQPPNGTVREDTTFVLPLQGGELNLLCTPQHWHFLDDGDPTRIRCLATVQDGHHVPINGARVFYFSQRGHFYTASTGGSRADEYITGTPPADDGQALLWLRCEMQWAFPDPITVETTCEVRVELLYYGGVAADAVIVQFQRGSGG
ncbi:hypothetical protein KKG05_09820 [bacterium]|nr:hypothetical protein [bacterium]